MKDRFRDAAALLEALRRSKLCRGELGIARVIARSGALITYRAQEDIISQGGHDNDLFVLLASDAEVVINRRVVAVRKPGDHIGEMALIDSGSVRSATIRAVSNCVAWKISAATFLRVAGRFPVLWQNMALELSVRLRERNKYVRQPNPVPSIFVGSSGERIAVSRALAKGLRTCNGVNVRVWDDGIFRPSGYPLDSLIDAAKASDFSVMIVTGDDFVTSRGRRTMAPRDNVVYEAGLFAGCLGRDRCFIVYDSKAKAKLPSDLAGITYIPFSWQRRQPIIAQATKQILEAVDRAGVL